MSTTGLQIIADALAEIGVLGAGETPTAEDAALGLRRLNAIVDDWNAERGMVMADVITTRTIAPNVSPHTLYVLEGSEAPIVGPTWTDSDRPVDLLEVNLVVGDVRYPLKVYKGIEQWATHTLPEMTSAMPCEVSYVAGYPTCSFYFWPVPTTAYTVEIYSRIVLSAFTLALSVKLAPGYQDAYMLTLAESLAPAFGQAARLSQMTVENAKKARARVWRANRLPPPALKTADRGVPGSTARVLPTLHDSVS
jgi:hypothetical protein